MSLVDTVYQAQSSINLMTAVNAYLAGLTNPIIKRWNYSAYNQSNRIGTQYSFSLTIETAGGAAIATPWLLDLLTARSAPPLQAAIVAYRALYPTAFISGSNFKSYGDENTTQSQLISGYLRNMTAGASANYLISG